MGAALSASDETLARVRTPAPPLPDAPARITAAEPGDEAAVGLMYVRAWLETYPNTELGIDRGAVEQLIASRADPIALPRWRAMFADAAAQPHLDLCLVVRVGTEVAGFLSAYRMHEDAPAQLGDFYLLDALKGPRNGRRVADELMSRFDDWSAGSAVELHVVTYNARAIAFYHRHGFRATGEVSSFGGVLPISAMARPAQVSSDVDRRVAAPAPVASRSDSPAREHRRI